MCLFFLIPGAGLSVSDNESGQGSQEGGTLTDSQIVELRRIPIADTHLWESHLHSPVERGQVSSLPWLLY
jgi:hypothetical protein